MSARRRRTIRVPPTTALALQPRDVDVCELTGLARYVSVEQLCREFFRSQDSGRRRIRRLFDAGILNCTLVDSRASDLVSLTRLGLRTLEDQRPELKGRIRLPCLLRSSSVLHHLMGVDSRLFAAAWGATHQLVLLRWSHGAGDLGRELGLPALHLEPDGLVKYWGGVSGQVFVAIEIDVGGESLSVLRDKLEKYRAPLRDRRIRQLWLVVLTDGRRRTVGELLRQLSYDGVAVVLTRDELIARPIGAASTTHERRPESDLARRFKNNGNQANSERDPVHRTDSRSDSRSEGSNETRGA